MQTILHPLKPFLLIGNLCTVEVLLEKIQTRKRRRLVSIGGGKLD
jgi:hypothetical protein